MPYPHVRRFGQSGQIETDQRRTGARQARRIALDARRRQELELQRQPAPARHSRPIRRGRRPRLPYRYAAAVVLAVVAAVAFAANGGMF
jgi:hypothetical protein